MATRPTFQLSYLREIGWTQWDPIGLSGLDDTWPANEYDSYLIQAASRVWDGQSDDEVADYLIKIETDHMGMVADSRIRQRAMAVVKSIREYVDAL